MRDHGHALDGKLHDDCDECDKIRNLASRADREAQAQQLADRYAKVAVGGQRKAKRGSG